jgi:hypothetical protein
MTPKQEANQMARGLVNAGRRAAKRYGLSTRMQKEAWRIICLEYLIQKKKQEERKRDKHERS